MYSFESDQVETKCRLARCSNHMDGKDCSFESSERAITCHTNPEPGYLLEIRPSPRYVDLRSFL